MGFLTNIKLSRLEKGDLIILKTEIDEYIGFVNDIYPRHRMIWISQAKSLVSPLFFNYSEIIGIKKVNLK